MAQLRRVGYLWQSAHQHAHTAPELSRTLAHELLLYAEREGIALPQRLQQRVCYQCCTVLVPGLNSTATQRRWPRRPAARRRELRVRCHHCGHTAAFAMAAKPSGRAGLDSGAAGAPAATPAPAAAAPSAAAASRGAADKAGRRGAPAGAAALQRAAVPSGKSKKQQQQQSRQPAPTPAAASSSSDLGTGLFGFDFVPLG